MPGTNRSFNKSGVTDNMKKTIAILALALLTSTSFGAAMMQDTSELALSGLLDFDVNG